MYEWRQMSRPIPRKEVLRAYAKLGIKKRLFRILKRTPAAPEKIFGFSVDYLDYRSFSILFDGIFLRQQYYFHSQKPDPLIIDCGSNIGMAILYFKKIYPESRVIAFEPWQEAFDKLAHNIVSNDLSLVSLHRKAVHDKAGAVLLFQGENDPGSLRTSINSARVWNAKKIKQEAEAVCLSDYIVEHIDLLKLDIEGAESGVIEELATCNKLELIRELIVEYHHHISHRDDHLSEMLRTLECHRFGYQLQADFSLPHRKGSFQNILIYAYRKS